MIVTLKVQFDPNINEKSKRTEFHVFIDSYLRATVNLEHDGSAHVSKYRDWKNV